MASPDVHRRARPRWAWAVALVALAVAVPVLALVERDAPPSVSRDDAATTVSAPAAGPGEPVEPGEPVAPSEEAEAVISRGSARGPLRALFFGDSYFIGGGYTGEDNSMARLAAKRLGWVAEINGGGGTGFVQTNYEYDLGNYLDQIAEGAFDVGPRRWVVIEGGNNDVGEPLADIRTNARRVLRIAQRTFPKARIVLVGPLDTDSDHTEVVPIIKVLRQAATKRSVPFVSMKNWLAGHYDLVGPDSVHPYPKGHRVLGRKLAKALFRLGA